MTRRVDLRPKHNGLVVDRLYRVESLRMKGLPKRRMKQKAELIKCIPLKSNRSSSAAHGCERDRRNAKLMVAQWQNAFARSIICSSGWLWSVDGHMLPRRTGHWTRNNETRSKRKWIQVVFFQMTLMMSTHPMGRRPVAIIAIGNDDVIRMQSSQCTWHCYCFGIFGRSEWCAPMRIVIVPWKRSTRRHQQSRTVWRCCASTVESNFFFFVDSNRWLHTNCTEIARRKCFHRQLVVVCWSHLLRSSTIGKFWLDSIKYARNWK